MWVEIDFITPIRELLMQYPAIKAHEDSEIPEDDKYVIEYLETSSENALFSEASGATGYAVEVAGGNIINTEDDITGNTIITEQENLTFRIDHYVQNNSNRRAIANRLINIKRWINYQNSRRGAADQNPKLPKFSMTNNEEIKADGGMAWSVDIDSEKGKGTVDSYIIQLHLTFDTVYENDKNDW